MIYFELWRDLVIAYYVESLESMFYGVCAFCFQSRGLFVCLLNNYDVVMDIFWLRYNIFVTVLREMFTWFLQQACCMVITLYCMQARCVVEGLKVLVGLSSISNIKGARSSSTSGGGGVELDPLPPGYGPDCILVVAIVESLLIPEKYSNF